MEKLNNLSKTEIETEWRRVFKLEPPKTVRRNFLLKHIYWQQQVKQHGGLSTKAKNQLKRLMQDLRDGKELNPPNTLNIKSGTKLLREYKGIKHEVVLQDDKYIYQGKAYRSLSQIARDITGTRWNGKLFFGVK